MPLANRKRAKSRTSKRGSAALLAARRAAGEMVGKAIGLDVRYLQPPPALFSAAGLDSLSGAETLIAPHWDGVVQMIGPDGAGYSAALQLLGRLDLAVEATESRLLSESDLELDGRLVLELIDSEILGSEVRAPWLVWAPSILPSGWEQRGGAYGKHATLRDSLGWPHATETGQLPWWSWRSVPSMGRASPDSYQLVVADGYPDNDGRDLPEVIGLFSASLTWTEAFNAVATVVFNARSRSEGTVKEQILWFRQTVVSAVVDEFESRGFVDTFDSYAAPGGWEPTDEDLDVARRAHDFIQSVPNIATNRTAVIKHVREETSLSERTVRDALTRLGAYRSGKGRGEDGPDRQRAEFIHFRFIVAQVCGNGTSGEG